MIRSDVTGDIGAFSWGFVRQSYDVWVRLNMGKLPQKIYVKCLTI